jgi:hypothetical protein
MISISILERKKKITRETQRARGGGGGDGKMRHFEYHNEDKLG